MANKKNPCLVVKLSGGLGNQIFQWMLGKSLAFKNHTDLIFDTSEFNINNPRKLLIPLFCRDDLFISLSKKYFKKKETEYVDIKGFGVNLSSLKIIRENKIGFEVLPELKKGESYYLDGYWQSYKYWDDYSRLLNGLILDIESYLSSLPGIADKILPFQEDSICALHIRRGDYLLNTNIEYHGVCQLEYFIQGMQDSHCSKFHIYTDDITFVSKKLSRKNIEIITNSNLTELLDFINLTRYKNLIISNSSFSYIAAFIAYSINRAKIIAPSKWYYFTDEGPDFPKEWTKLNPNNGLKTSDEIYLTTIATVAVVIPVHSRTKYIERALNSAINQNHKPIEIIISLNGSTDTVKAEIHRVALKYSDHNVRVIETDIASLSKARNIGIINSTADYVAFLDDDDIWDTHKLELQIIAMITNNADLVSCDYYQFDDNNKTLFSSDLFNDPTKSWASKLSIDNCLSGGSSVLAKKDIFHKCGLFDESMPSCEDHDMWRRIAISGYKVFFIRKVLVGYQVHDDNMTKDNIRMIRGELIHLSKILDSSEKYRSEAKLFYTKLNTKIELTLAKKPTEKFYQSMISTHLNSIIFDSSKANELIDLYKSYADKTSTIKSKIILKSFFYFLFLPSLKLGLGLSKWFFNRK